MKNLKSWFFSTVRGFNGRGKYINFNDNSEPDQTTFETFTDSVTFKKFGSDYQDQASPQNIIDRLDGDKFTIPANLPEIVKALNSILTLSESVPDEVSPRRIYTIDAPLANTNTDISGRVANKYVTPKNLPKVIPSVNAGNQIQVTSAIVDGQTVYSIYCNPSGSSGNFVLSTYDDLASLVATDSLVQGTFYKFNYTTIHKIPYTTDLNNIDGNGVLSEDLILLATSVNTFSERAWSVDNPSDIIYYRFDDNRVVEEVEDTPFLDNDGQPYIVPPQIVNNSQINYFSPLTQRTGRIIYREDPIYRKSSPYDYINCRFRRWKLQYPLTITSPTKPLTDDTAYSQGDVILSGGTYYLVITDYTTGTSSAMSNFTENLSALLSSYVTNGTDGNSKLTYYMSPTPNTYTLITDAGFGSTPIELAVDNTKYKDFSTFDNQMNYQNPSFVPNSPNDQNINAVKNFNCHIENYIPAWLEQVTWEYYPNIVFFGFANNVKVDIFSENITILNSCNLRLGSYNKTCYISTFNSHLNSMVIGDNNSNIFVDFTALGLSPYQNKYKSSIGSGNNGIFINSSMDTIIGNKNYNVFLSNTKSPIIGDGNILQYHFSSSLNTTGNYNFRLYLKGSQNTIGDNNADLFLLLTTSTIGNRNVNLKSLINVGGLTEGIQASTSSNITITNNNLDIQINGTNTIFDNVKGCRLNNVFLNNCVIKNIQFNLILNAATLTTLFKVGLDFQNTNTLFGNVTIDTDSNTISSYNYNMVSPAITDKIFSRYLTSYTDPDTFVEQIVSIDLT